MSGELEENDLGMNRIEAEMRRLASMGVKVGILAGSGIHDGTNLSVADIGALHEFGIGVPERSFIRSAIDEGEETLASTNEALVGQVIDGSISAEVACGRLGLQAEGMIQLKITDGPFVPNATSTVKKKGSSRPLMDTGQMRQAVTHEVTTDLESAQEDAIGRDSE